MTSGSFAPYLPWIVNAAVFLFNEFLLARLLAVFSELAACIMEWTIVVVALAGAAGLYYHVIAIPSSWSLSTMLGAGLTAVSAFFYALYLLPSVSARSYWIFALLKTLCVVSYCMYVTYNYELLQPVKIGLYFIAGYYFLPLIVAIGGLILAVVGLAVAFALYIIVAIPLALIGALAALLQFVARWLWNAIQEAMGHLPASDQGLQWIAALLGAIGTAQILDSLVHTFSSQDYWGVVRQVAFTAVALVVLRKAEGPQSTPSRR